MSRTPESQRDLSGMEILAGLGEADIAEISARCRWRCYHADQVVLSQGESGRTVCLLTRGTVRALLYSDSGRLVTFRDIEAGQVIGEFSVIDGQERTADVVAVTECDVANMSAEDFWWMLDRFESVRRAELRALVANIRSLSSRVFEYSSLTAPQRLWAELGRLADEQERRGGPREIPVTPTHEELAARISATREAVTRELNRLERCGAIRREGRRTLFPDRDEPAQASE